MACSKLKLYVTSFELVKSLVHLNDLLYITDPANVFLLIFLVFFYALRSIRIH